MPNLATLSQFIDTDLHALIPAYQMIAEADPELDDQLHDALMQSFDCGDPIALSFT